MISYGLDLNGIKLIANLLAKPSVFYYFEKLYCVILFQVKIIMLLFYKTWVNTETLIVTRAN